MSDLNVSLSSGVAGFEADRVSVQPVAAKQVMAEKQTITQEVKTEAKPAEVPAEEVEAAMKDVNAFVQNLQRNLSFSIDDQLGQPIIAVKDIETDEVIRQIPSEELVVLRKKMDDVTGILFDTKV